MDGEVSASGVPRGFNVLTEVTVVAAAGSAAVFALTSGWQVHSPARFWVLTFFVVIAELLPIPVPGRQGRDKVTVSTAFAFAVLLSVGVLPACAVYAAASVIADLSARTAATKVVFNAAHYVLAVAAGGAVLALGGLTPPVAITTSHVPLVLAVGIAMFLVNHIVAGAGAGLLLDVPLRRYLRTDLMFQAWTSGCVLAVAPAVVVSAEASLALVPVAFIPLLAIYVGWRHAAEELQSVRRRAEVEERYRLALDASGDGMFDFDLSGGVAFWSESLLEILGYGPDELSPDPDTWVARLVHPADQALFHPNGGPQWQAAERFEIEARLRHANGGYAPYSVRGSTQRDERGEPSRVIGSVRDLSAARRAELQRLALARDLHDGVLQDLAASLIFVASARKVVGDDSVQADKLLDVVAREIKASVASLRLVLESLRSNSSLLEAPSSVQAAVRAAAEEFGRRGPNLELEFNVHAAEGHYLSPVALQTLSHVLREALRNARQHSQATNATIDVRAENEQLLVDIRDDGVGFDRGTVVAGHYGLAGMRERAQRAGGTLEVARHPSGGTNVQLRLPLPFQERIADGPGRSVVAAEHVKRTVA
jgi:PAS domain S-box-containing protein